MFKAKLCFAIICLSLINGCSLHNNTILLKGKKVDEDSTNNNFVPAYRIGLNTADDSRGLLIEDVGPMSPARAAGIQEGDLIVAVNGLKLNNKEFLKLMDKNNGEKVHITINRTGQTIDCSIKPLKISVPPSTNKIRELLFFENEKVSLAVIVADAKNSMNGRSSWGESEKHKLQGAKESDLLYRFGRVNNFSLIDRSRTHTVLNEYKINTSGLMFENERELIGRLTGATHLLVMTLARYPNERHRCEDVTTARLIELESGKVLAVDQQSIYCE